jgi:putative transposase
MRSHFFYFYFFNMDTIKYQRNLPHIHPVDTALFITFRLYNSIPGIVCKKWDEELKMKIELIENMPISSFQKRELTEKEQKLHFQKSEIYLHTESKSDKWLAQPEIGQLVHDKIVGYHEERYNLLCSCVMPNHVLLLFEHYQLHTPVTNGKGKDKKYPVAQTMRYIKGSTARGANSILDIKGQFWQNESYDHYIRNEREMDNVINYILQNPVKAGLIDDWTKWPFTYLADKHLT